MQIKVSFGSFMKQAGQLLHVYDLESATVVYYERGVCETAHTERGEIVTCWLEVEVGMEVKVWNRLGEFHCCKLIREWEGKIGRAHV